VYLTCTICCFIFFSRP